MSSALSRRKLTISYWLGSRRAEFFALITLQHKLILLILQPFLLLLSFFFSSVFIILCPTSQTKRICKNKLIGVRLCQRRRIHNNNRSDRQDSKSKSCRATRIRRHWHCHHFERRIFGSAILQVIIVWVFRGYIDRQRHSSKHIIHSAATQLEVQWKWRRPSSSDFRKMSCPSIIIWS